MATETKRPISTVSGRPLPRVYTSEEVAAILAKQGGPKTTSRIEYLLGAGEDLWDDDAELDAFLKAIDDAGLPGD